MAQPLLDSLASLVAAKPADPTEDHFLPPFLPDPWAGLGLKDIRPPVCEENDDPEPDGASSRRILTARRTLRQLSTAKGYHCLDLEEGAYGSL